MPFTPTTSGTYTFRLNILDAIVQAYGLCGYTPETMETSDWILAKNQINLIFSDWTARGNMLFEVKFAVQPVTIGQQSFTLPGGCVDVYEATLRDSTSGQPIDAPFLQRISRAEYLAKPDKTTQSTPTMYFIDRQYTPVLYMYQTPQVSTWSIAYFYVSQIQDVNTASEVPDIPYRWQSSLVSALAVDVAFFKKQYQALPALQARYERSYQLAAMSERDSSNLKIIFDLSSYTSGRL